MGFWSKLGKIASFAAPIVAAPFTGGASLALIGAGAGAAGGALQGGGLKGALMGAGLGAATAGIGSGAGSAAGSAAGKGASMSLGSTLGSILKNPAVIGAAGQMIGGMGQAATHNRGQQTDVLARRDQIGSQAHTAWQNQQLQRALAEIQQRQAEAGLQDLAFKQAMRSALAMNMKDASFSRPEGIPNISFSGGARPSALGAQGAQAAELMNNIALQKLMNPQMFEALPAAEKFEQSELPKASIWEKIAGPVGLGLSAVGAGLDAHNKTVPQVPPQAPGPGGTPPFVPDPNLVFPGVRW